jgi:two-component system, NtrC family, response regulator AtoC
MTTLGTILVCDDEELIRWSMAEHLRGEGYRVVEAEDGEVALERLSTEAPDLVITDLKMPRLDGMELLRRIRELDREVPVIVITAHGAVETAVQATQLGARHYITKPFDLREVSLAVSKVLSHHRLQSEVRLLRTRATTGYDKLLGQSAPMQRLYATLARLESIDAPTVLIHGESGTGKDLVARAIHNRGPRKDNPFMEVDCASLPEALIESELFGHEKGSFTDARSTKRGQFEVARGGSIFLDEIGEMTPGTQAKLLRALENRTFKRVGGVQNIQLDAGIIAASNKDLAREVKEGRFREDLFFRLNVVRIDTPPLRERREDIAPLVHHFITRFNREFRKEITGISAEATMMLDRYRWPGNVRELRNVIERTVILEADTVIEAQHLPAEIRYGDTSGRLVDGATFLLPEQGVDLEAVERSFIVQAIDRTEGNQSAAARLLGISRYALRYRLEKFGLAREDDDGE